MPSVDLSFPTQRFRDSGATPDELDELRRQFLRSDVIVQKSQVEFWAGKPASALRDYLDARREVGDLAGAAPVGLAATASEGPQAGLFGDSGDLDADEADAVDLSEIAAINDVETASGSSDTEGPQGVADEA